MTTPPLDDLTVTKLCAEIRPVWWSVKEPPVLGMRAGFDVMRLECPDCCGIGLYQMPDDSYAPCVVCKSQGWIYISSY